MEYITTGTTPPILIEELDGPKIFAGQGYFLIKILNAQAAFEGSIWDKVTRLVVASRISINHPLLGSEPQVALQHSREVKRKRSEQLGLTPTLIDLMPATMDRVTISLDFILDKENRLHQLVGLINDKAFVAALALTPVALGTVKVISTLAGKILDSFLPAEDKQPILQFFGDFNISNGLSPARYAILGSQDESNPLPRNPKLTLCDGELLSDGGPISTLSYVILEIRTSPWRTIHLGGETPWVKKLEEVDRIATRISKQPVLDEDDQKRAWKDCDRLLQDAHALLQEDPLYIQAEVSNIIDKAWDEAKQKIYPSSGVSLGAPPILDAGTRQLLSVQSLDELRRHVDGYKAEAKEAERLLTDAGVLVNEHVP
jgi:hypothetical protein